MKITSKRGLGEMLIGWNVDRVKRGLGEMWIGWNVGGWIVVGWNVVGWNVADPRYDLQPVLNISTIFGTLSLSLAVIV